MSYGQQSSNSEQSSGLSPYYRNWFSTQTPDEYGYVRKRAREAERDPGGLQFMDTVNQLLPIGKYGLPTGATEGTYQLGRDLMTKYSGTRAMRGFNQPENLEGVLGDAVRMASGQLIPLSTQVAMQRAQMAPALREASFGYASSPMKVIQSLLSSSGQSKSSSSGFGFDVSKLVDPALAAMGSSDRRLKSNIVRIGKHPLGIGWYRYTIDGHTEEGVMADEVLEVKPEAVITGPDGYYMVNYGLIGRV